MNKSVTVLSQRLQKALDSNYNVSNVYSRNIQKNINERN